jgi:tetratricopeptide (TPR) repeat protein
MNSMDMRLLRPARVLGRLPLLAGILLLFHALAIPSAAQTPRRFSFRAVHYEVNAALLLQQHSISSRAVVEFEAKEPSAVLDVELHQDLTVHNVAAADGRALRFDRDADSPLRLTVTLPQTVVTGQHVTVTFDYTGPLFNDETSPVKGMRLAYIASDSAILLQAGRWFPLADYPAARYTANFNIITADDIVVLGTGQGDPPQKRIIMFEPETPTRPGQPKPKSSEAQKSTTGLVYAFHVNKPEPAGTFIAGSWKSQTAEVNGINVTVFGPPAALTDAKLADSYAESLSNSVVFYSDAFGPLENTKFLVAQLPAGNLISYSAPGVLLLGPRQWDPRTNYRLLAQMAAGQWFGNSILPASANDVWLTDGLSRYAGALFEESTAGREALDRALEDFAVGALMFEQAAPIAQASLLKPLTPEYRSVVQNKGAMVFHMLRAELGDATFNALLRRFYTKFAGRSARIEDFEALASQEAGEAAVAAKKAAPNLTPFFTQWLNSTGVPEFKLNYATLRLRKGFAVRGTIQQDLETFSMPVEMKVSTEGNPEMKVIQVTGTRTDFNVETFGRPKPMGITIDPNNDLLKSSPKLRVRALIARGEELAERGKFYEAIQEYQRALDVQRNSSLAHFRMGEAAFYQKNYQAAASAFRETLEGDLDPKWVEVWSRVYLGKIYDISGLHDRAANEYQKAIETRDDTGGAQAEATRLTNQPFKLDTDAAKHTP